MGKASKKTYVYQYGDFLQECESAKAASRLTGESLGCINDILKKPRWSKKGYLYSYKELREDELPFFNEPKIRVIPRTFKTYKFDDDDIDCYIPAKKEKAKEDLRQFIYVHLAQRWKTVPACVAKMERHYVSQLLSRI